jgi:hypothetical protein
MSTHNFERGDYVREIGGTDYGFWFEQDAPGIPGMIIVRNASGSACVGASEFELNEERNAEQIARLERMAWCD